MMYLSAVIMFAIAGAWIYLVKFMIDTFRLTPQLDDSGSFSMRDGSRVSIILPARNEENFLADCLDSLVIQDYNNYEIIVVDDSSDDATGNIIAKYAKLYPKLIVHVTARSKPTGWMGKNWACMEGYAKATGDLLLFTDADTTHRENVISLAVGYIISHKLDALTAIPRLLALDFWTRVTLPMITTFMHTRFSALNVNNPSKKTGYFFGSFFILSKNTYQNVGMHEGVKNEIIEDGALGRKVKDSGHKMRMVKAEHLVDAVWARDRGTLWNALKRLVIPLYLQNRIATIGILVAVTCLLFAPFVALGVSSLLVVFDDALHVKVLLVSAVISSSLIYLGAAIEAGPGLGTGIRYAAFAPLGGLVIILGFLSGVISARFNSVVSWRGREYSVDDHTQNPFSIS